MTTRTRHAFRFPMPTLALKGSAALRLTDLIALSRQRQALGDLDDRTLEDLGITRDQAVREARRPLWDVPETWRT